MRKVSTWTSKACCWCLRAARGPRSRGRCRWRLSCCRRWRRWRRRRIFDRSRSVTKLKEMFGIRSSHYEGLIVKIKYPNWSGPTITSSSLPHTDSISHTCSTWISTWGNPPCRWGRPRCRCRCWRWWRRRRRCRWRRWREPSVTKNVVVRWSQGVGFEQCSGGVIWKNDQN